MVVHKNHTHDKTLFKCKECGQCGIGRSWFSNHRRKHREKTKKTLKVYTCQMCPYEQHNLHNFRRHAKRHMIKPDRPKKQRKSRTCESCGKIFVRKYNFDRHMKAHLKDTAEVTWAEKGSQVFTYRQCDADFARKDLLVVDKNAVDAEEEEEGTVIETFRSQIPVMSSKTIFKNNGKIAGKDGGRPSRRKLYKSRRARDNFF